MGAGNMLHTENFVRTQILKIRGNIGLRVSLHVCLSFCLCLCLCLSVCALCVSACSFYWLFLQTLLPWWPTLRTVCYPPSPVAQTALSGQCVLD